MTATGPNGTGWSEIQVHSMSCRQAQSLLTELSRYPPLTKINGFSIDRVGLYATGTASSGAWFRAVTFGVD